MLKNGRGITLSAIAALTIGCFNAGASVTVDYIVDAGGNNTQPLNGLAARGTFTITGNMLTILLENTSTGIPDGFETADSLLVSVGFNLPAGVSFVWGDSAVIGPGSIGLGSWSSRGQGDSVGEEWLWSNQGGSDLLAGYNQIITTSSGLPGSGHLDFHGNPANVGGPFGGIAASPPILNIPPNQPAVSDSILFTLTLNDTLSASQLVSMAQGSRVEYGSDMRYLDTPAPGALGLLIIAGLATGRRRRRA